MVNKDVVLNHIAKSTNRERAYVESVVTVEYWKDIVDFTSYRGVDLFAEYLKTQDIQTISGSGRLFVKIPSTVFQEKRLISAVTFCIDNVYAAQFKRKYKDKFKFL